MSHESQKSLPDKQAWIHQPASSLQINKHKSPPLIISLGVHVITAKQAVCLRQSAQLFFPIKHQSMSLGRALFVFFDFLPPSLTCPNRGGGGWVGLGQGGGVGGVHPRWCVRAHAVGGGGIWGGFWGYELLVSEPGYHLPSPSIKKTTAGRPVLLTPTDPIRWWECGEGRGCVVSPEREGGGRKL